jgi:hypothetical protein
MLGGSLWLAGLLAASALSGARAAPITLNDLRAAMLNEGYLQHQENPFVGRFGDEVTGWVDVRHPVMDGTTNSFQPYDRSNHFVNVRTTVVAAEKQSGGADVAAAPDQPRDLHRSNKIYAQAGVSVIRKETGAINLDGNGGRPDVQWPINQAAEDDAMKGLSRSGDARTINTYYVQKYDGSAPNGLTSGPAGYAASNNDGSGIADSAQDSTYAHEIGHMILNGPAVHSECPTPSESCDTTNWMYQSGSDYAFNQIEKNKGRIESSQIDRLYENFGTNGRDFVQKSTGHENYGNRVDWDFVTDDIDLEGKDNGADDHKGIDSLYFAPGTTVDIAQPGHDHTGLDDFNDPGDWKGNTFRYADVFSLSLLYADFDRFAGSDDFSRQNGALDYRLYFVDMNNVLHEGILTEIFSFGWTISTLADDYLGRWKSPVDAVGLYVLAKNKDGTFDGNVQIDAVIVANSVPEPHTLALFAAGLIGLLLIRRRTGPAPVRTRY